VLTPSELATLDFARQMGNQIVHAQPHSYLPSTKSSVEKLKALNRKVREASVTKTLS
jgi:hypothetical protein